jgi:hypothetical protein
MTEQILNRCEQEQVLLCFIFDPLILRHAETPCTCLLFSDAAHTIRFVPRSIEHCGGIGIEQLRLHQDEIPETQPSDELPRLH